MAFSLASLFGLNRDDGPKELTILTHRCPQNHKCPSVKVCPTGALTQKGFQVPKVNRKKCIDCGKCTRSCFPRALVMKKVAQ